MAVVINENFTGGLNRLSPSKLARNEASMQQNFLHIEGALRSMEGRVLYTVNAAGQPAPIIADKAVTGLWEFLKTGHTIELTPATTRKSFILARCGEYLWLNVADASDAPDWRPIVHTPGSEAPIRCAVMNRRLCIATGGKARVWDGYFLTLGNATHNTVGNWTSINAPGAVTYVRVGDMLFLKRTDGSWVSSVIVEIDSASSPDRVKTQDSIAAISGNPAYIIARVWNLGIAAPTKSPEVEWL